MTKEIINKFIKKYRLDVIVIASVLLISLTLLLVSNLFRVEGAYAEVVLDGKTVSMYPLSIDGVYSLNGGTNELTIKDGMVYMSDSKCPTHSCEKFGKIRYVGEIIECQPNHLVIKIVGQTDDSVDFVS